MDNRFIVVLHEVDRGNTQILVDKDGKPVVTPIEK